MKKPRVAFTPCDNTPQNLRFFEQMKNSLRKFHSEEELPLLKFDNPTQDRQFWYRATPQIAKDLIKEYEMVLKLDCDQIFLSSIAHILEDRDNYDVGTVLNDLSLRVWDIETYSNCGLVVMKSEEFINHWWRLCNTPHFLRYQYREQDLLSILTSDYFNYRVKCFDDSDKWHGLIAKPFWPQFILKDKKVILESPKGEKELCVIHFAGGDDPTKGNFRVRFKPEIVKYIEEMIKP